MRASVGLQALGAVTLGQGSASASSGGSVTAVEPPAPDGELVPVGGSPGAVSFTFSDAGGRIESYSATLTSLNASGSPAVSDGATDDSAGPWTLTGGVAGGTYLLTLDALDTEGNTIGSAEYLWAFAAASDGPADVLRFSEIGDYNFTTTGGTGGSGGAGPHTLPDGTSCTVYVVGTGASVAEFSGGKLVGDGDTNNHYVIEFDLGSDTQWVPLWVAGQWTLGETASSGSLRLWLSEAAGSTVNVSADLQLVTTAADTVRFRYANSATTFNNVLDVGSLSLGATDQLEFLMRGHTNAWSTVEARQGVGSLPAWNAAVMADVNGDVRNSIPSWRRYLKIRVGGQDASLDLRVQKGLEP